MEMGKWEWKIESSPIPSPGDDSKISQATTTHHLTFNHEGHLWQQIASSKYVSGLSPLPIQQKNYQVDSNNNNLGESNMIREQIINNL